MTKKKYHTDLIKLLLEVRLGWQDNQGSADTKGRTLLNRLSRIPTESGFHKDKEGTQGRRTKDYNLALIFMGSPSSSREAQCLPSFSSLDSQFWDELWSSYQLRQNAKYNFHSFLLIMKIKYCKVKCCRFCDASFTLKRRKSRPLTKYEI
jgi:hypothetical protein